jgi:hypothetical protein
VRRMGSRIPLSLRWSAELGPCHLHLKLNIPPSAATASDMHIVQQRLTELIPLVLVEMANSEMTLIVMSSAM